MKQRLDSASSDSLSGDSLVRIWHATSSPTEACPVQRRCQRWLAAEERQRADQFRHASSRNQHVIGRGMARRLLSGETWATDAICFELEAHGKPFVSEPQHARRPFNVAHTQGLVLCAIAEAGDVLLGVDVERLQRRTDPALAQRYFSKPEIEFLNRQSSERARRESFLRIWTLKEAFIKALGTGLRTPLADFAFEDINSPCPTIRMLNPQLESDRRWRFFSLQTRPGFVAALAVAGPPHDPPPRMELYPFDDWLVPEA